MLRRFWRSNLRAPLCSDQWNAVSLRLKCSVSSGERAGRSLGTCVHLWRSEGRCFLDLPLLFRPVFGAGLTM